MCSLGAIEEVFLLAGSSFGGRGVGIGISDTGSFAMLTDEIRVPNVDDRSRGCGE